MSPAPGDAEITLAVLAGGQSSRMGFPKPRLRMDGRPILAHLLKQMAWPGQTMLVTAPGQTCPPGWESFDQEVVDPIALGGPLRGLLTALQNSTTRCVIAVTVDMPCVTRRQLDFLAERLEASPDIDAIMIQRGEEIEPFPSIYRRSMETVISAQLNTQNRSMRALAKCDRIRRVPAPQEWPEATWINLNYPSDLAAAGAGVLPLI